MRCRVAEILRDGTSPPAHPDHHVLSWLPLLPIRMETNKLKREAYLKEIKSSLAMNLLSALLKGRLASGVRQGTLL